MANEKLYETMILLIALYRSELACRLPLLTVCTLTFLGLTATTVEIGSRHLGNYKLLSLY